jgi:hypothetical protein
MELINQPLTYELLGTYIKAILQNKGIDATSKVKHTFLKDCVKKWAFL